MQKNNCLFSSASVEWATPQALFDELDAEFHFDLDPCSTHENAKCAEHFTKTEDGLSQNWGGQKGILQSAVWKGASEMDQESARRGRERRACGDAHSCADGHASFPRLHIPSGRNPVFERTDSVCRFKMECAFPVYGGYFRGKNR